ncbi:TetR/AcrR family transcriptional regulator [Amycolatopsis jiangsuensis]|uniref:AcrR family transcriptional regulator n=2 Tax=Amycolatopsis jiangsuensis TaxID=1181879 RepID=A0A840IW07_9PSEU|nr:AcrR family transcriptional regulator [Amycolatopsis jiangsuensis]
MTGSPDSSGQRAGSPTSVLGGDPAETEQAILRRGLDAFAELGYQATTVRVLAQRLGVSHNFISVRYGSKFAFWCAVVDFASSEALESGGWIFAEDYEDDQELIAASVRKIYRVSAQLPQLHRIVADEAARDSERLDYLFERYLRPFMSNVEPSIHRLVAKGIMPPVPVHLLYFAVMGPTSGLIQQPLARKFGRPEPSSDDEDIQYGQTLAGLLLSGIMHKPGA